MYQIQNSSTSIYALLISIKGIERVLKGGYAFLMESSQIEYFKNQNCNLTQIGGLLDSKGYGIAMPVSEYHQMCFVCSNRNNDNNGYCRYFDADSPWRTHISQAILKLQEEGKLTLLKKRWWYENNGGVGNCDNEKGDDKDTLKLGMDNVGGVFIVVGIGMVIAFIIGIIDFLWNIRQIAIDEKVR